MNYEEAINELWAILRYRHGHHEDKKRAADWLRQHDARLIRELAAMPKHQWDSYEEGRIDAWLELRADEIEKEK